MVQTLDVGCGDRPTGTVNVDIAIGKSEELYFNHRVIDPKLIPNFVLADAHYLPFQDHAFSKVHCFHTLEHLENPIQILKEMKRVVNGSIEVRIPNHLHEAFQCLLVPKRRKYVKQFHKHSWDKKSLEKLGFRVHYNFYFLNILRKPKRYYENCGSVKAFLIFLFYSFGSTFFPFIPDELIARAHTS